ncbi:hypothetical protein AQUCO_00300811v1 [Aquilegia coerulea]|uniref:NB-ARC domain-containing protein n=1 Tax=Aquilegia coerulea TaxID=218851 RepID=A0A2G5F0N0_AQUCA|nr:hypothetical protein AQUCO_00300811v1 [Aquilegia coerulea]
MDTQQANDLGFFRGLFDQCPAMFEKTFKQVFEYVENPFSVSNAVCISGWQKNIGNERILKYLARRALVELKLIDILIWLLGRDKVSSMRNFQLQIADRLGIQNSKDDEPDVEDDEQIVDEALSTQIHARLKNRKFILVHNGDWSLVELWRMGIPNMRSSVYSIILVSSPHDRMYHQLVTVNNLSDDEIHDLLYEECLDICDHLSISSPSLHITPDVVMDCILYLLLFDINIRIETIVQYWLAEGLIGTPAMDLDAIFKCGQNLLDELHHRHLVELQNDHVLVLPSKSPKNCTKLSTIITTRIRLKDIPEAFFENMVNVRVLSLVRNDITCLPSSIVHLGNNLKLLDLKQCTKLESLPLPYLRALGKLEVLDLSGTPLTELPDNSFEDCQSLSRLPTSIAQPLEKLQLLHLSRTKLLKIPEQFFQGMVKLKDLNLSLNPSLRSLPMSIFNLVNLKKLNLKGCSELQNMTHCLKHFPSSLEELNLSRCDSLQDIKLDSSSFPNLRILDLKYTPVKFISL